MAVSRCKGTRMFGEYQPWQDDNLEWICFFKKNRRRVRLLLRRARLYSKSVCLHEFQKFTVEWVVWPLLQLQHHLNGHIVVHFFSQPLALCGLGGNVNAGFAVLFK